MQSNKRQVSEEDCSTHNKRAHSEGVPRNMVTVKVDGLSSSALLVCKIDACKSFVVLSFNCRRHFIIDRDEIIDSDLPQVPVLYEAALYPKPLVQYLITADVKGGLRNTTTPAIIMCYLGDNEVLLRLPNFFHKCSFSGYDICPREPLEGLFSGFHELEELDHEM